MRTRILEITADLLAQSATADVSTRAVCEAAGIQQPTLYRMFGDKNGLIAAAVDYGFGSYLEGKRAAVLSADPVADLISGWDGHTAFALDHPNLYRLMYAPGLTVVPEAVGEAHALLRAVIERCAAAGRLRVPAETATRMVMSANSGVALSLITRPEAYPDPAISAAVRDALLADILTPAGADHPAAGAGGLAGAAITLAARLDESAGTPDGAILSPAERALLGEWLRLLSAPESP